MKRLFHEDKRLVVASAATFEALPTIRLLDSIGINFTFLEVGVGPLHAMQRAESLRFLVEGRDVIFLGTCGSSLSNDIKELVLAGRVEWNPLDVHSKESYLINGFFPAHDLKPLKAVKALCNRTVTVSCTSSIANTYRGTVPRYENLELYSVAQAWTNRCQSFTAILGVTNCYNAEAHSDWKENARLMAEKQAAIISKLLA